MRSSRLCSSGVMADLYCALTDASSRSRSEIWTQRSEIFFRISVTSSSE